MVAIDLDGTTVVGYSNVAESKPRERAAAHDDAQAEGPDTLPAGTIEAAAAYQEAGGHLVIATGRDYFSARDIALQLRCEQFAGFMVCGNGATVHDLRSSDPSKSIVSRETLRADTLSSLYRSLLRTNPALVLGVKLPTGGSMYNTPKEDGILPYARAAVDDRTFEYVRSRDIRHTLGVENYCVWLDENYADHSNIAPDSIFAWCFGMHKEQLTTALQPAFDEFSRLTGEK